MKKTFISAIVVLVWVCATATDRFYIEDFSITQGETRPVSIILENERAYTAFQCDIYIPDGLAIEKEDGDYIFDLTSRKARDHNIASQTQMDGAIRVMSYSPSIKAYSGNSGALVTFNVIASEDFVEPATIQLSNILFTTTAGIEIPFADEQCTVRLFQLGDVNCDGLVDVGDVTALIAHILGHEVSHFNGQNADLNYDGMLDVADVTKLIGYILGNVDLSD